MKLCSLSSIRRNIIISKHPCKAAVTQNVYFSNYCLNIAYFCFVQSCDQALQLFRQNGNTMIKLGSCEKHCAM